ncbi:hypothetical protein ACJ6WF_41405 [Streptomyces sp. MMS24-I2-30]|uniref:hypothetical protein n=1 Tax=Streptomyces sp. MMS24-I2-30 TaxID=3351564 RepID=UPI0038969845
MGEKPERYRIEFASGTAASVQKRRSFRDHARNDIEPVLAGWPPGRVFAVRGFFGRLGRHGLNVVTAVLMVPLYIIADVLGSPATPDKRGKLEEPENEVHDFPVVWAGEGEAARTLPWQLDPSRRPWRMVTELELADSGRLVRITCYEDTVRGSRFLTWGGGEKVPGSEAVLWEVPREDIARAEVKPFSMDGADFKVFFKDGSWTRLTTLGGSVAREMVALLC